MYIICFVCTNVRTTATEWKLNCNNNNNDNNNNNNNKSKGQGYSVKFKRVVWIDKVQVISWNFMLLVTTAQDPSFLLLQERKPQFNLLEWNKPHV